MTIQDVIAVEGPRLPDVDHSQKKFNTGMVVVVEHGTNAEQGTDRADQRDSAAVDGLLGDHHRPPFVDDYESAVARDKIRLAGIAMKTNWNKTGISRRQMFGNIGKAAAVAAVAPVVQTAIVSCGMAAERRL